MGLKGKKAQKKLTQKDIPQKDSPQNGVLVLNANANTAQANKDMLIVLQMVDGSTSTKAHFVPEPHHTVEDLRREAYSFLYAHVQETWGVDTAQSLASFNSIVFTAQVPQNSTTVFPEDTDTLASIGPGAIIYARIPTVRKDGLDLGVASQGDPGSLTTPLFDRIRGATCSKSKASSMCAAPQPIQPTPSTAASDSAQLADLLQQVANLTKTVEDTRKELTDTKKQLGVTEKELADTKNEVTDLKGKYQELLGSQDAVHGWIAAVHNIPIPNRPTRSADKNETGPNHVSSE